MTEYRRTRVPGATYFFTVNCYQRKGNTILIDNIEALRNAFQKVKIKHPFTIDAIVILPDHLHCLWTLPVEDKDFGLRWGLIKSKFSRSITKTEKLSQSRLKRRERGIWQRRFWEHLIRDDEDYTNHVNYTHWNPVKHGLVKQVKDWPYSSFHRHVDLGTYPLDWAFRVDETIDYGE